VNSSDGRWRTAGERIATLLDAVGSPGVSGAGARERAEQLVREIVDLYGAGLARIIETSGQDALDRYASDDLVASLLLVHGLHPHDVHRRVSDALDSVRPYLGSHGGDVELLDVVAGPAGSTVRLRFAGSCKSCPSSSVTLELAVQDAVRAAAPEVTTIEVVTAEPAGAPVIPVESLLGHLHSTRWEPIPGIAELTPGEVGGFDVAGITVLACRVGDDFFAYRDRCPGCDGSMAGAVLHRRMGSRELVLRCPRCHAHFDIVRAGASLDGADTHLEPMPLLVRDGVLCLAATGLPTGLSA
jgi:Fe-S cluster biogenesis protein NfuA/nitrite reductase/ring-hydroxylating ferredoxin subunit